MCVYMYYLSVLAPPTSFCHLAKNGVQVINTYVKYFGEVRFLLLASYVRFVAVTLKKKQMI